jgi:hypothetical protein
MDTKTQKQLAHLANIKAEKARRGRLQEWYESHRNPTTPPKGCRCCSYCFERKPDADFPRGNICHTCTNGLRRFNYLQRKQSNSPTAR